MRHATSPEHCANSRNGFGLKDVAVAGCHQGADGELYAVGAASGPAASAVQTGPTVGLQYGGM